MTYLLKSTMLTLTAAALASAPAIAQSYSRRVPGTKKH